MKKLFALMLSVLMILSLFVGCGGNSSDETTGTTTEATQAAEPAGTLLISMGAAFEIVYDQDGNVLELTGTNDTGKTIAAACTQYEGRGCVFAARGILRYASDNKLIGDARSMAVRVKFGDPLPSEDFLDTIITDCQYLADEESTGIRMVKIGEEQLDENGLLTSETAKRLAARFLGCTEADLTGEDTPTDNVFTFSFEGKACTVDAATGLVTATE